MTKASFRKVTQKDIAKEAGVSQALVSLILGGGTGVEISSENRVKIVETAERLGYKKRKKPKARRKLLAFVYPEVQRTGHKEELIFKSYEDFYGRMRMRLEEAAKARGYELMSCAITSKSTDLTQWLKKWDIQGVFWDSGNLKMAQWVQKRLPMVQIDRHLMDRVDAVMSHQVEMVEVAMRHLLAAGHQRIGFISKFPLDDFLSRQRVRGYRELVEAEGLESYDYSTEVSVGGIGMERLLEVFRRPHEERPTALVAPDHYAILIQKRLLREGFSLPEDLSIVGMDNITACDFAHPALTSVDGEYGEVMASAMQLMEDRIENPSRISRRIEISPSLVERESVQVLGSCIEIQTPSVA